MKTSIAIVDYGIGNLRSVAQELRKAAPEADVAIVDRPEAIRAAGRVVLPGQGAMPDCMRSLGESGLQEAVIEASRTKPLMGVCVGEQMLFEWSAEGNTPGLGLLPGKVLRFDLEHVREVFLAKGLRGRRTSTSRKARPAATAGGALRRSAPVR